MTKLRKKHIVMIAAAILLAVLNSYLGTRLIPMRRRPVKGAITVVEDVPPAVTFATVVLGGFRGVIADVLWLRYTRMQEENKLVELVQLAGLITRLEPHLDEVWSFHAWNMAYNISLLARRNEDRWIWVKNGIELLRDQGIPANPGSSNLCRELGWIFQHKLGTDSDAASNYFRTIWARSIDACLDRGGTIPGLMTDKSARLESEFRMSTDTMRKIESRFGRVDWRVPAASSLYWGWRALELASQRERPRCIRMVYTSLTSMVRDLGLLSGEPSSPEWIFAAVPNKELEPKTFEFVREAVGEMPFSGTKLMYVSYVRAEMRRLTAEGNPDAAARIFEEMRGIVGDNITNFPSPEEFMAGDESFENQLEGM